MVDQPEPTAILRKSVNALVEPTSRSPRAAHREWWFDKLGWSWAMGTVVLTEHQIAFYPSWLERKIGGARGPVGIELSQICTIELTGRIGMKCVSVHTDDFVLRFRCYGAGSVIDRVNEAIADAVP